MSKPKKQIRIRSFDPTTVRDGSVCVFIGKRNSGKSWAMRDLMWYKRDIPIGQIISGSECANPFFHTFFPTSYITKDYTPEIVQNILTRQVKIRNKAQKNKSAGGREVDTRFILVMDDCLYDNKWQRTTEMRNIFMNGRHFGVTFLLSMQYVIGIGPNLRTNIDYIFIFRDSSPANQKKLFDNFGGISGDFKLFQLLMQNLAEYECLVICTDASLVNFEDQVMYWKASERPPFRFGSVAFWKKDAKIKEAKKQREQSTLDENFKVVKYS